MRIRSLAGKSSETNTSRYLFVRLSTVFLLAVLPFFSGASAQEDDKARLDAEVATPWDAEDGSDDWDFSDEAWTPPEEAVETESSDAEEADASAVEVQAEVEVELPEVDEPEDVVAPALDESDVPEMRKIVELPITEDAEPVEDGMENAEYATVEEDAEVTDESPETEPVDQAMAEEMESGGDEVAEVEAEPEAEPEPAPVDRTKLWEGVVYTSQGTPEHQVKAIVIMGSRDQVYSLHGWNEFEDSIVGKTLSDEDLIIIGHKILNGMRDLGYVFTRVKFDKEPLAAGYVAYKVQAGEVGDVTVKGNRHYRADQVISSLSAHKGEGFNYNNLYSEVFSLNVKPDIRVDTKLNPRVGDDGEAIVDMDLEVEDRLPLHAAVTLSNTGTKETSDWRLRTVLQHVNLTKADDVLTAQWLTDPTDFDQVNAWSGSYYRPLGDGWSLNLYGGYSDSNIENFALDEFDIFGEGMFAGFRVTKMLYENPQMAVDASVGYTYQQIENNTEFAGQSFPDWEKDITLGMPYLTLGYSSKTFDRWAGKTFFSNTVLFNFGGSLGSTDRDEFLENYPDSEASFIIDRISFARFQKLGWGSNFGRSRWTMLLKLNAQLTDDVLPPAVQDYIGGMDSVRGYEESEVGGDQGITGTLEFRTPLFTNFLPLLKRDSEFMKDNPDFWGQHRLQFLVFFDWGYVHRHQPAAGLQKNENFMGVGAGLRFSLSPYTQMKLDYGFPLEETEDSDDGRLHMSVQAQF